MTKHSGGCLCGAIKYSFDDEPVMTGVCLCENCQRQSGTAFSIIVGVTKISFKIEDEKNLSGYVDQSDNGSKVRRQFCGNCGSFIVSLIDAAPEICMLKAGTLMINLGLNQQFILVRVGPTLGRDKRRGIKIRP